MGKIPTAEDYMARMRTLRMPHTEIMKGFARRHVEAALKEASENVIIDGSPFEYELDKNSILNAYALENIK